MSFIQNVKEGWAGLGHEIGVASLIVGGGATITAVAQGKSLVISLAWGLASSSACAFTLAEMVGNNLQRARALPRDTEILITHAIG